MLVRKPLAVILVALALGACAPSAVYLQTDYNRSTYDHANFTLYHGDRDTRVLVYGDPFGMGPRFARAVTDAMQGANEGRPTHFTTTPGPSAEPNMWVVMAFNADVGNYDLCDIKSIRTRPLGDTLSLKAAWCFDGRQDSMVDARVAAPSGVGDPRFQNLVKQTVLNLFPQHINRLLRDNNDNRRARHPWMRR